MTAHKEVVDTKGTPIRYWGCRAIDDRGMLDIVHDRITYNGPEPDNALPSQERRRLPFIWWLNKVALPKLRQQLPGLPHDEVVTIWEEGRYCLIARRAGGYLSEQLLSGVSGTALAAGVTTGRSPRASAQSLTADCES